MNETCTPLSPTQPIIYSATFPRQFHEQGTLASCLAQAS